MADFIAGFKYVLDGFGDIYKPGVRFHVLIPLLINAMLFAGVIIYGATLLHEFTDTWLAGWWEWVRWLLWPLFVMLAMTVIFFCFSIVANLIAAPFNGFLAGAVEYRMTGVKANTGGTLAQLPGEIKKAVLSEGRKFLYFVLRVVPLVLLFFIPIIQFAAPFIWFLFGAWMLALEYVDFPMGNHGISFMEQKNILKQRRQLALGFGTGIILLTMIPVINFLALPVGVCAATRLYIERLRAGA
jgi:CysZ protein